MGLGCVMIIIVADLNEGRVALQIKMDRTRRSWSIREEEVLLDKLSYHIQDFPTEKNYGSLSGILGRSGVGFNLTNDFKIDCDNEQWEQIITADKNVRNMRFNGGSEYVASTDAPSGANPQNNKSSPQGLDQSASDSDHETRSAKKKNKKRKTVDRSDILLEMLAKNDEDINSRLDKLTNMIGYEFDLDVAGIILEKVQRLDLFMCLPEAFRHTYVVIPALVGDKPTEEAEARQPAEEPRTGRDGGGVRDDGIRENSERSANDDPATSKTAEADSPVWGLLLAMKKQRTRVP
ncbi:hypothetical protein SASPL_114747 [Salvia splendens]|uniref:Myb/SANT-like domain-containing protein n=1 Tax=Salvia splendens TaxID=180675 RepID=A0A8X9A0N7_SALSN|nr:hypothetical protein SASPL_114747 [Salvia splendens]